MIYVDVRKLKWGWTALAATDRGICLSCLPQPTRAAAQRMLEPIMLESRDWQWSTEHPHLNNAWRQLEEYFAGRRKTFDVPLDLSHGTAFQQRIWRATTAIPAGKTESYGGVARSAGFVFAGGGRAVGGAMRTNRLPPFVPCHRVIGSDGRLTGFGGGLPLKAKMLIHEGVRLQDERVQSGAGT